MGWSTDSGKHCAKRCWKINLQPQAPCLIYEVLSRLWWHAARLNLLEKSKSVGLSESILFFFCTNKSTTLYRIVLRIFIWSIRSRLSEELELDSLMVERTTFHFTRKRYNASEENVSQQMGPAGLLEERTRSVWAADETTAAVTSEWKPERIVPPPLSARWWMKSL